MIKKTTQFRSLLNSKDLDFIMEAHNGISAKIVEEAGFKEFGQADLHYQRNTVLEITTKLAGHKSLI